MRISLSTAAETDNASLDRCDSAGGLIPHHTYVSKRVQSLGFRRGNVFNFRGPNREVIKTFATSAQIILPTSEGMYTGKVYSEATRLCNQKYKI